MTHPKDGGEVAEVGEPDARNTAVLCFELEEYPEPKVLTKSDLEALYKRYGSQKAVAKAIGTSRVFVTENMSKTEDSPSKRTLKRKNRPGPV